MIGALIGAGAAADLVKTGVGAAKRIQGIQKQVTQFNKDTKTLNKKPKKKENPAVDTVPQAKEQSSELKLASKMGLNKNDIKNIK